MKLVSFQDEDGFGCGAVVDAHNVIDLTRSLGTIVSNVGVLIEQDLLDVAARFIGVARPTKNLQSLTLLPVIPSPGKIVCIGLNYREHVEESCREVTEAPTLFLRVPSSQVGQHGKLVIPKESHCLDYEGEIAVVIGTRGRRIREADAWRHIAGYSCYNDGSVRDWQLATSQWTAGKNFWCTAGFGPWLVTSDEIAPAQELTLVTRLNGQVVQRATTLLMLHSIPRQIAHISAFMPLEPGDVVVTGTPGGVGHRRVPAVYLKDGDVVEVEVDAVGVLRNEVVKETNR